VRERDVEQNDPVAWLRKIHLAGEAAGRGLLAGKENRPHAWMRHIRLHVDMSAGNRSARRVRESDVNCGVPHMSGRRLDLVLHQDGLARVSLTLATRREQRGQKQIKGESENRRTAR